MAVNLIARKRFIDNLDSKLNMAAMMGQDSIIANLNSLCEDSIREVRNALELAGFALQDINEYKLRISW